MSINLITKNMKSDKAIKLLAKSMYRELIKGGYSSIDIINFSKELIDNLSLDKSCIQDDNYSFNLNKI